MIVEALAGEMPEYLARLEAEAAPDAGHRRGRRSAPRSVGDLHPHSDWSDGGDDDRGDGAQGGRARPRVPRAHRPLAPVKVAHGLDAPTGCASSSTSSPRSTRSSRRSASSPASRSTSSRTAALDQDDDLLADARRRRRERALEAAHEVRRDDATHGRRAGEPARRHARALHRPNGSRQRSPGVRVRRTSSCSRRAAHLDKAVEINCRPERLDPPMRLLKIVVDAGCKVSIDSDAHAVGQLEWQPYGCARAADAGVPVERIVNTWPAADLLAWTASHAA